MYTREGTSPLPQFSEGGIFETRFIRFPEYKWVYKKNINIVRFFIVRSEN